MATGAERPWPQGEEGRAVAVAAQELFLRDVIDIPESVHAGDFKIELSGGFSETEARVAEYVVTDQLRQAFARALSLVRAAVRDGTSHAAYLHGSFGSGKSHFLTVLHAVLNNHPAARAKKGLQPVVADHDEWLRGKKFLMVPYHLVGATDIDSAVLGGYVATVRKLHPDQQTPPGSGSSWAMMPASPSGSATAACPHRPMTWTTWR